MEGRNGREERRMEGESIIQQMLTLCIHCRQCVAHLDAFLCSSLIFSRRRRTRVVRCWSMRSPETATPVCSGYIGVESNSSSNSFEKRRMSSGETWFQPRFAEWNGGTESRCFRTRLLFIFGVRVCGVCVCMLCVCMFVYCVTKPYFDLLIDQQCSSLPV